MLRISQNCFCFLFFCRSPDFESVQIGETSKPRGRISSLWRSPTGIEVKFLSTIVELRLRKQHYRKTFIPAKDATSHINWHMWKADDVHLEILTQFLWIVISKLFDIWADTVLTDRLLSWALLMPHCVLCWRIVLMLKWLQLIFSELKMTFPLISIAEMSEDPRWTKLKLKIIA